MRLKAGTRSVWEQTHTLRGGLYGLLMIGMIAALFYSRSSPAEQVLELLGVSPGFSYRDHAATWLPMGLLILAIYSALTTSAPPLYYSRAERMLLFPAPIPRNQLITFKFIQFAAGAALSAFVIALITVNTTLVLFTTIGLFITLIFAQLLTVCISLITEATRKTKDHRHRFRAMMLLLLVAALCAYGWQLVPGTLTVTQLIATDPVIQFLLLPFKPFAHLMTANSWNQLIGWLALTLSINAFLLYVAMMLEQRAEHSAVNAPLLPIDTGSSDLFYRLRFSLADTGTGFASTAATIAWRQWRAVCSHAPRRLWLLATFMAVSGPFIITPQMSAASLPRYGLLFAIAVFIVPRAMAYDFRNDGQHLSFLRTLPARPIAIVFGQLIVPIAIASLLLWLLMASAAVHLSSAQRLSLAVAAAFVPLLNFVVFASENLFFLLFPRGHKPFGRMDFDFMGRMLAELLLKQLALLLVITGTVLVAFFCNQHWWPTATGFLWVSWFAAAIISVNLLPVLGWAFQRSNP
ncbi:MAG: putative ABC exporter domain-containing protein [Pseudomonadales bacterium]